ncbi:hypothetical protein GOL22_31150 [Sinorhizobium medicae]|nr:hypothetical protein [Sinorhizobium medicae]
MTPGARAADGKTKAVVPTGSMKPAQTWFVVTLIAVGDGSLTPCVCEGKGISMRWPCGVVMDLGAGRPLKLGKVTTPFPLETSGKISTPMR